MTELVSVVIPSYNRFELLCHSIQSVLNNTYENVEIIVVNDKSTDNRYYNGTLESFPKTKIIHLAENMKKRYNLPTAQGATRQVGIENASGEYIGFLDDDDFFEPTKIETQINLMKLNNSLFSCTNMKNIIHNSIGNKLDYKVVRNMFQDELPNKFTKDLILCTNFICCSTVIIHCSLIEKTGRMYPEVYEDWRFWLRALDHTPDCLYINEPLTLYTLENTKEYHFTDDK